MKGRKNELRPKNTRSRALVFKPTRFLSHRNGEGSNLLLHVMASMLAHKWDQPYSTTLWWLRCRLTFSPSPTWSKIVTRSCCSLPSTSKSSHRGVLQHLTHCFSFNSICFYVYVYVFITYFIYKIILKTSRMGHSYSYCGSGRLTRSLKGPTFEHKRMIISPMPSRMLD